MVTRIPEYARERTDGLVEVSIPLEDRAHRFEACKTYSVFINRKTVHAMATDTAEPCPPEWDIQDYDFVDKLTATQIADSGPTLAISDQPFGSGSFTVNVYVTGSDDDGLFGFAVGFQPGHTTNASADYLLLDWRKTDESYDFPDPSASQGGLSRQGIALSRVHGVPDADEFWQHGNLDGTPSYFLLEELQRDNSPSRAGWWVDQEYEFTLELTSSNFKVHVDGTLVIDSPTPRDYTGGRLAFYMFSQDNVGFFELDSAIGWQRAKLSTGMMGLRGRVPVSRNRNEVNDDGHRLGLSNAWAFWKGHW